MSKNYIKLQNQGNIYQNLMLLNEMNESIGYADENGYFSKRAVAEIAINSAVVTSAGKMGDDIIALVNDTVSDESRNSVLQNAKQRMQILRVLGLVASDYDAGNNLTIRQKITPIIQENSKDFLNCRGFIVECQETVVTLF